MKVRCRQGKIIFPNAEKGRLQCVLGIVNSNWMFVFTVVYKHFYNCTFLIVQ
jgi:hypothetical protein